MIEAFGDKVIVKNLEYGERQTKTGIILKNDDGKVHGIRPRWAQVHKVGENVKLLEEDQWILIEHGRWSHKFEHKDDDGKIHEYWLVEYKSIWGVASEKPETFIVSDSY